MTVTAVREDPEKLTMTLDAAFDAPPERVWQVWADPRQLERWWGPPTYPATVTAHDLRSGGRVEYHMTGPEGDQSRGYWEILEADAPRRLRRCRRQTEHRHAAQRGACDDALSLSKGTRCDKLSAHSRQPPADEFGRHAQSMTTSSEHPRGEES
jgi:uncharacterized protein YndB with AHSA1/START domain